MQRSIKFAENIISQYGGRTEDVQEEVLMFGCPFCGHINPDHRWSEPFNCLVPECDCDGSAFQEPYPEDSEETRAAIYQVLTA